MQTDRPPRRNLVIVRAGDQSLHPTWLSGAQDRSWDLLVNYFGDDPDRYRVDDVMRIDSKGPKWRALKALIEANRELIERYDYVWFPDDDIACKGSDIETLFSYARKYRLKLCQPSLTWSSYLAVWITAKNPFTRMRYTNYVENMVPCFEVGCLFACVPVMGETISGWGIDHVWPTLIGDVTRKIAIIDRASVQHTRPIGGGDIRTSNYAFMQGSASTPREEAVDLLKRHNIRDPRFTVQTLVFAPGVSVDARSRLGEWVLRVSYRLIIYSAYILRSPMRWELNNILGSRLSQPSTSVGP